MTDQVIVADELCVKFDRNLVLDHVSFSISQGEIFTLLGGNGAGKSTMLKTLLGVIKPTFGSATILGCSLDSKSHEVREKVAYLPESVMLYGHLTGFENIEYFLSLAGVKKSRLDIEKALDKVALNTKARQERLSTYSKGMRQKTAIALALLRETPVLFLDEPTSGLDPIAIDEFNQLVTQLSDAGTTVFMVTHDVYGACQVAHRIGLLDSGNIVGMFERQGNQRIDTQSVYAAFGQRKVS